MFMRKQDIVILLTRTHEDCIPHKLHELIVKPQRIKYLMRLLPSLSNQILNNKKKLEQNY